MTPAASAPDERAEPQPSSTARNSSVVVRWTLVSRITGLARVVTIGAVLGPTFFGNLYQSTNALPNLVYEFLTGSLFASLLVPPLVRALDRGDHRAASRLAGGFLGVVLVGFAAVAVLVVAAGQLVFALLTLGVDDAAVVDEQQRVGMVLLALLMPQLLCYGIAGTAAAVMNARGRFALAAAAPSFENVGMIATLGVFAVVTGGPVELGEVSTGHLVLLGAGTTGAVALHAAAQWWGAHRAGVTLVPRAGWRDPEVRALLVLGRSALGHSGLSALRVLGILVVANSVAGGVVAVQLALAFYHLVTALSARPMATALLPALSRVSATGDARGFRDELDRGTALVATLAVPATICLLAFAEPLARGVTYGELATPTGVTLVAVSVAGIAVGVLGDAVFVLCTAAGYARDDARTPFHGMLVRLAVTLAGMGVAMALDTGAAVLLALGLAITVGDVAGAAYLSRRVLRPLPPGDGTVRRVVGRATAVGTVMAVAGTAAAWPLADRVTGTIGDLLVLAAVAGTAGLLFVGFHVATRSGELAGLLGRDR